MHIRIMGRVQTMLLILSLDVGGQRLRRTWYDMTRLTYKRQEYYGPWHHHFSREEKIESREV